MPDSHSPRPLRVALIGSRGIPASYGGYETLMEELAPRLARHGVEVTVYCRSHHTPRSLRRHRGARLVVLPTLRAKYLDTPVHTFLSCLHAALLRRFDAVLVVNGVNVLFVPLLRLARLPTALHVDGIEQRRGKWGALGRGAYALSERLAGWLPQRVVTDAEVIRRHYLERRGIQSTMIPYGVDPHPPRRRHWLQRLRLTPRRYLLYVSRFEPENNPHRVVEAFRSVRGDLPLVMVGDAPYAQSFIARFRAAADARVLFPGAIYGDGYRELLSNALAYIHATEVGGTHPALVEALGYGNLALVNDTPENREVAADCALYFSAGEADTLTALLQRVIDHPEIAEPYRQRAVRHAAERYSWDAVTDRYLELFESLAGPRRRAGAVLGPA